MPKAIAIAVTGQIIARHDPLDQSRRNLGKRHVHFDARETLHTEESHQHDRNDDANDIAQEQPARSTGAPASRGYCSSGADTFDARPDCGVETAIEFRHADLLPSDRSSRGFDFKFAFMIRSPTTRPRGRRDVCGPGATALSLYP